MPPSEVTDPRRRPAPALATALWFALVTIAFGTSYALLPLYSSNQNHHFLMGVARAGTGWLRDDWLASTADPFPVFTLLVIFVHRFLNDTLYYALYYLLLGAYAYGLIGIVEHVWPPSEETRTAERLVFLAVLCALHNEVIGYLFGIDLGHLPWWQMTHWGVAEQEIFGHGMFQPSAFGLLLPLAIRWWLQRQPIRATTLMGTVLLVHFSYVITVVALTVAFMIVEAKRTRNAVRPLAIGLVALAFATPAVAYVLLRLGPTSRDIARQAALILVQHLPQETDPAVWLGAKASLQGALMIAGVALAAGTDLFLALLLPLLAGVMLTAAQLTSHHDQLALLFPWRVSVLLVPLSTALLVRYAISNTRTAAMWASQVGRRRIVFAATALVLFSMAASTVRMTLNFAYFYDYRPLTARLDLVLPGRWRTDFARALGPDTLPMMDFVGGTVVRGDVYLIPPELERFRLRTGAPVVADFKSHPYKDREVLEWFARLRLVEAFYGSNGDCAILGALGERYGVTHVVFDERVRGARCPGLESVYSDPIFDVYRLNRPANARIEASACLPSFIVAGSGPRGFLSSSASCSAIH